MNAARVSTTVSVPVGDVDLISDHEPQAAGITPALEVRGLYAGYRDLAVVRDLSLTLNRGEVVALLGPNGAGKTTTVLTLAGALPPLRGSIRWEGSDGREALHRRVRRGLGLVPEQRSVIQGLSVKDNLRLGRGRPEDALSLFPDLEPLLGRSAGLLSGGEQQMLTLARCMSCQPSVLLADELSLGLAPKLVERLLASLRDAADRSGTAVLLVEQQVKRAIAVADRYYFLRHGVLTDSGRADDAAADRLASLYLAGST